MHSGQTSDHLVGLRSSRAHLAVVLVRFAAALITATVLWLGSGSQSASAAPVDAEVQVTQAIVKNGNEVQTAALKSGDGFTMIVKYKCASTTRPCKGAQISVPIPNGLSTGAVTPSSDVASTAVIGSKRIFTMNASLSAGTTGALTIDVSVPAWITPDGASFSWTASMAASNAATASSDAITVTGAAAINSSVDGSLTNGNAVGGTTTYSLSSCLNAVGGNYGPLGVVDGSTFTATIPDGATFVSANNDGTYEDSARTVTWTLGAQSGCSGRTLRVKFPDGPTNVVGAVKHVTEKWTGRKVGESNQQVLGTKTIDHTLIAPVDSAAFAKQVSTPRSDSVNNIGLAALRDTVRYTLVASNDGTNDWASYVAHDDVPAQVKVTGVDARNPGDVGGSLWIASKLGADGVAGGGDDDTLVKVADIAAHGSANFDPYGTSSGALNGTGDVVTQVEVRGGGVIAGASDALANLSAQVLVTDSAGHAVAKDQVIENTATLATTFGGPPSHTETDSKTARFKVDEPTPSTYTRPVDDTIAPGVRVAHLGISFAPVVNDNVTDPVFIVILPAHISLVDWTGPTDLPTATVTVIPNWQNNGTTLVRWRFPANTVALKNHGYTMRYTAALDKTVWSNRTVHSYVSSRSQSIGCEQQFFNGTPDSIDADGDGDTSEVLCEWPATIAFNTNSSAVLEQSAKGSWDSDYVASPGHGYTTPGSNDTLQVALASHATMDLDNAVAIDVLPRPGDTAVLSSATRNPTEGTFPVYLRGRPTVPTLASAVTTYYSTVGDICKPELNYSPSGCNAPGWTDWDTIPPANLKAVTAVKFDYGTNTLHPGDEWDAILPVTTPTTGATEADYAVINPDPTSAPTDEVAYNSAGFVVRRTDLSVNLLPSEGSKVGLDMPSIYGPPAAPPIGAAKTTSATGTATQTTTVTVPPHGSAKLLDGLEPVDHLVVAGVGTYDIDPTTGVITFAPVFGFSGTAPAVGYQSIDVWGQPGISSYTATVNAPAGPNAAARSTTGIGTAAQTTTITVPTSGAVHLLDGLTPTTHLVVTGVGTYDVNASTGVITFVAEAGYTGNPAPVAYEIVDGYGQTSTSTYAVHVTAPALADATAQVSSALPGVAQSVQVAVPAGGHVKLLDGTIEVTSLTMSGVGTYVVDPVKGTITFTPVAKYVGEIKPVSFRVTDVYGQTTTSTYAATVNAPPLAAAAAHTSTGSAAAAQTVTIAIPSGGKAALLDADGNEATTVTVTGEGSYTLDTTTGVITFTPEATFSGRAGGVRYRVYDDYGQKTDASYTPTVQAAPVAATTPAPAAAPAPTAAVCSKSRVVDLHWKIPKGASKIRWVAVHVDGRTIKTLPGTARSLKVPLATTGPRLYKVWIVAAGTGKTRYESKRDYRMCNPGDAFKPAGSLTLARTRR